jgi:hypothetical protein
MNTRYIKAVYRNSSKFGIRLEIKVPYKKLTFFRIWFISFLHVTVIFLILLLAFGALAEIQIRQRSDWIKFFKENDHSTDRCNRICFFSPRNYHAIENKKNLDGHES